MTKDNRLSRISRDPNICFGKPYIRSYPIWVSLIDPVLDESNDRYALMQAG
jgi:uncharacterized protein (DUF433 family)